jgi:hypothetical protein
MYSLRHVLDDAKFILQKNAWITPDKFRVLVFLAWHCFVPRCFPTRRRPAPCFLSRVVAAFFFLPRVVLFHIELKMGFSLPPTTGYAAALCISASRYVLVVEGWIHKAEEAIRLGGSC